MSSTNNGTTERGSESLKQVPALKRDSEPTNGPQPRTGPSRSGDWKDGLSPTSLGRVAALEACRDAADSSVEEMSAAMKELQQMQRGAAVSDRRLVPQAFHVADRGAVCLQQPRQAQPGDALERWVQTRPGAEGAAG